MPIARRGERRYRFVFRGESEVLARAFPRLTAEFVGGDTALMGSVLDQAQLRGIIDQAESLGCDLVSVNPIEPEGRSDG